MKMISSRLSRIANKQRIKVYVHEQKRASGTALGADLPLRKAEVGPAGKEETLPPEPL